MAWSPGDSLVIGISSRALFNLDEENWVYQKNGTEAFIAYQQAHEADFIQPGVAFGLVRALLSLNERLSTPGKQAIEVVVISKNHPDCSIRIARSLAHHRLPVRRAVFTGGQHVLPYVRALEVDLFLSKEEDAVKEVLQVGISAGLIYGGPMQLSLQEDVPVLAFDGDAVLFSDEADRIYRERQLVGFAESELKNASVPLPAGPLRRFAGALEELRASSPIDTPPFRIALVTARDLTYCERPMQTLRSWGIRIDQGFFVSDMSKNVILAALKPLIFFDDNSKNCADACASTPTVQVPLFAPTTTVQSLPSVTLGSRPERFSGVCRLFLKKGFGEHEVALLKWHDENLNGMSDESFTALIGEVERSTAGTPAGRQRRAAGATNEDYEKLVLFLENLRRKHAGK